MPNGIAVLQAALSGKRVRHHEHGRAYCGEWIDWDRFRKFGFSSLDWEWDLDEPTLTFAEAVAAMDAGQTVAMDGGGGIEWQHRLKPETDPNAEREYECQRILSDGTRTGWHVQHEGFGFDDFHADWRIVREEAKDERPTIAEITAFLFDFFYGAVYPLQTRCGRYVAGTGIQTLARDVQRGEHQCLNFARSRLWWRHIASDMTNARCGPRKPPSKAS